MRTGGTGSRSRRDVCAHTCWACAKSRTRFAYQLITRPSHGRRTSACVHALASRERKREGAWTTILVDDDDRRQRTRIREATTRRMRSRQFHNPRSRYRIPASCTREPTVARGPRVHLCIPKECEEKNKTDEH